MGRTSGDQSVWGFIQTRAAFSVSGVSITVPTAIGDDVHQGSVGGWKQLVRGWEARQRALWSVGGHDICQRGYHPPAEKPSEVQPSITQPCRTYLIPVTSRAALSTFTHWEQTGPGPAG